MTENYPPPPGGEQPGQPQYPSPPPQGQPAPPPYYGQQPPQGYSPPQHGGYPPQYQQPQPGYAQYPQPVMFVPAPRPPKPASWGRRIGAGIVGIVFGLWSLLTSVAVFSAWDPDGLDIFAGVLLIGAGLATVVMAIILLATARAESSATSVGVLATAGAALIGHSVAGHAVLPMSQILGFATVILVCLAIGRDNAKSFTPSYPGVRLAAGIMVIFLGVSMVMMFSGTVRIMDGLELTLPLSLLAAGGGLFFGVLMTSGSPLARDLQPLMVLGVGVLSLMASIGWTISYSVTVIELVASLAAIVLSIILLVKTKGTKPGQWFTPPPYDQAPVRTGE